MRFVLLSSIFATVFVYADSQVPGRAQAEEGVILPSRTQVVDAGHLSNGKGVSLKSGVKSNVDAEGSEPDVVFEIQAKEEGRYSLSTFASVDDYGMGLMKAAKSKFDSLFVKLQFDDARATKRVVMTPWGNNQKCRQISGNFNLNGKPQKLKIWLPEGVILDYVELVKYVPPKVPAEVVKYQPPIVPPASHPRLWVNAESLPLIRDNLTKGENAPVWEKLKQNAAIPFEFNPPKNTEIQHNANLEGAAANKAFHYLMSGDKKTGREALDLMLAYLPLVEFGNILDITREVGRAIYNGSLVYDWCYPLASEEERAIIRTNLLRLAEYMECGWPPFRQSIINGHGNEAQISRDLLSMSIAIYEDNPEPYRYCSFAVLEQLVPMRNFEYETPRHNQGSAYGQVRYVWDLHAAWLFRRMTGKPVFDPNIGRVYTYWIYSRLPNGSIIPDGDCWSGSDFWRNSFMSLLCYSYDNNPVFKYDFYRNGGVGGSMAAFLLLNDPDLKPAEDLEKLPLTIDFGPVIGGMIARTGWNISEMASDVVAEIKGGGYHAGNHQHADAGAFQIFCRGSLASNISQYKFYGSQYDMNFAKRSIAKSMLLIFDPKENTGYNINDGGSRNNRSFPRTPEEAQTDKRFIYGKRLACGYGPSPLKPMFSYFAADLTSAYSEKVKAYNRNFCFVNLGEGSHPAVVIILDELETADPAFKRIWQVNSFTKPSATAKGVRMEKTGDFPSCLNVDMVIPAKDELKLDVLSGTDSTNVFGTQYTQPYTRPDQFGHRVMFSTTKDAARSTFLAVLQVGAGNPEPMPYTATQNETMHIIRIADRVVCLPKGFAQVSKEIILDLPNDGKALNVFLTGLSQGDWKVTFPDGKAASAKVMPGNSTLFFQGKPGRNIIATGAAPSSLPSYQDLVPAGSLTKCGTQLLLDENPVTGIKTAIDATRFLISFPELAKVIGTECTIAGNGLNFRRGNVACRLTPEDLTINGYAISMTALKKDSWMCEINTAAWLLGISVRKDILAHNYFLKRDKDNNVPENVLFVTDSSNLDLKKLNSMLGEQQNGVYWDAEGDGKGFTLLLAPGTKPSGVAVAWLKGDIRQASFAIETSTDGKNFTTRFKGISSGKTADLEKYPFEEQTEVKFLRFVGFGNTTNKWNSIKAFKVLD